MIRCIPARPTPTYGCAASGRPVTCGIRPRDMMPISNLLNLPVCRRPRARGRLAELAHAPAEPLDTGPPVDLNCARCMPDPARLLHACVELASLTSYDAVLGECLGAAALSTAIGTNGLTLLPK